MSNAILMFVHSNTDHLIVLLGGLKKNRQNNKYPLVEKKRVLWLENPLSGPGASQLQKYKITIPSLMSYQMTVTVEVW